MTRRKRNVKIVRSQTAMLANMILLQTNLNALLVSQGTMLQALVVWRVSSVTKTNSTIMQLENAVIALSRAVKPVLMMLYQNQESVQIAIVVWSGIINSAHLVVIVNTLTKALSNVRHARLRIVRHVWKIKTHFMFIVQLAMMASSLIILAAKRIMERRSLWYLITTLLMNLSPILLMNRNSKEQHPILLYLSLSLYWLSFQ